MSFIIKNESFGNVAKLTLEGSLDSSTAPQLQTEVQAIVQSSTQELVIDLEKLNFMSSAGIRVIILAKQKLGINVPLILVKPQQQIIETLKMTGLIQGITIADKYPG
jgi:anti-anti-sigma factor